MNKPLTAFLWALNGSKQAFCIDENLLSTVVHGDDMVALIFNIVKLDLQKMSSNPSLSKDSGFFTPAVLLYVNYYIHDSYINEQNINSFQIYTNNYDSNTTFYR